jgi:hypothetical protein
MLLLSYDTEGRKHSDLLKENVYFSRERFHIFGQWPSDQLVVPDAIPENVGRFYLQGLESLKAKRWDAAGAMFRKALDVATKQLDVGLKNQPLARRIEALFAAGRITESVRDWSHEIRMDGNDAVHDEDPETEDDAVATERFTEAFLTYTFTLPAKVATNRTKRKAS